MKQQDILRKNIKLIKAEYDDIYYKDFAEYLKINEHSFYNWLHGYYSLSRDKVNLLNDIIIDLLD